MPTSPYLAHLTIEATAKHDMAADHARSFVERFELTEMEMKILKLVIEGLNNEEIGQTSQLARETIKGYMKTLFRKLDVKNRTEAAVLAVREGLS